MSGICSAHQHHKKGCRLCEAGGGNMEEEWVKEFEELKVKLEWNHSTVLQGSLFPEYINGIRFGYFAACRKRQERIERLETSMVNHFVEYHLEGDGPEIDRWRAKAKQLEAKIEELERQVNISKDDVGKADNSPPEQCIMNIMFKWH